jgi:hypothetical protein
LRLGCQLTLRQVTFKQWRNGSFRLAAGGGRNDQRILSSEDWWNRSLLHLRKIAVARKKRRPGVDELTF